MPEKLTTAPFATEVLETAVNGAKTKTRTKNCLKFFIVANSFFNLVILQPKRAVRRLQVGRKHRHCCAAGGVSASVIFKRRQARESGAPTGLKAEEELVPISEVKAARAKALVPAVLEVDGPTPLASLSRHPTRFPNDSL